ncbi:hypothetical protein [Syntrophomonas erecta]
MGSITIFAGGYGSGKTEIALNYALNSGQSGGQKILADLDLVNPFFSSREMKGLLENRGIKLLAPGGDLAFGDVPSVPGEILTCLNQRDNRLFIDLAGDEVGALVLGYLNQYLVGRDTLELYLVLNPYRPFARDLKSVQTLKEMLERATHMSFTGIISNPNLVEETNVEVIRAGHSRVVEYGQALGLDIDYLTVEQKFFQAIKEEFGPIVKAIQLYLRPEWL